MSRFSQINFEAIDPDGSYEGFEGRFSRRHIDSRDLGVSQFRLEPGARSPVGHRHREQEEAYVVAFGAGRALLDEEVIPLRQWDVLRVAPEVARAFEGGPEGLILIAIGGPKPVEGDAETVELEWPD